MKLKDDSKAGSEDISENDVIIELSEKFLMGPDWTGFTCQYVVNYFIMFVHLIIVQQNYCVARQKPNLTNFEQLGTFLQFWTKNGPFGQFFFDVFRISEKVHTKLGDSRFFGDK